MDVLGRVSMFSDAMLSSSIPGDDLANFVLSTSDDFAFFSFYLVFCSHFILLYSSSVLLAMMKDSKGSI